jgi:tetrapyrrole methylase family protein/MazG family protein
MGKQQDRTSGALHRENRSKKKWTIHDLLEIMAKLRGARGCPWDREQTEQSLKKFLIEEAYETLEAIEAGTAEALKEELGDLLLQIVFLSRIAEEKGEFDFSDVVHTLAKKLIRRHPHVFPPPKESSKIVMPQNSEEVVKVWGQTKALEGKYAKRKSLLDGLPLALPALERSRRMSQRVSRVGFDWPDSESVWDKIREELKELRKASREASPEAEEELGDLLFTLVNWARLKNISAEEALRKANRRFARRFRQIEAKLREQGRTLRESTLEELDRLWDEAKKHEKKRRC